MSDTHQATVLDGVRILDLARWQAAPRGSLILRDRSKLPWGRGPATIGHTNVGLSGIAAERWGVAVDIQ